jgi:hypothetical protein
MEESLDTDRACPSYSHSSGVLIALVSQEGIRCAESSRRQGNSGAVPATVGGEPFSEMPLGFAVQSLGRRGTATTREPGDLPERTSSFRRAGRACGADFRCGGRTICHAHGGPPWLASDGIYRTTNICERKSPRRWAPGSRTTLAAKAWVDHLDSRSGVRWKRRG